jgi:hypothetical protein
VKQNSEESSRRAAVESLIERWRTAQKSGDARAYEELYAKKFSGVKRVGMRAFYFDRKRWLNDRRGMIRHGPDVSVDALHVVDLGATVVVRFEQTYSSKSFRDVGTKTMVLVAEGGALRIAREEMLSSLLAAPEGVLAFPDFAFVTEEGDGLFALLERHELSDSANVEFLSYQAALGTVKPDELPRARRDLVGKELVLYGDAGEVCRARAERLVVLARVIPHFGQIQQWRGEQGDPPTQKPQIAQKLAEQAGSGTHLALELKATGACSKARWARAADRPPPPFYDSRDATAAEAEAVLDAFKALPVYAENQRAFEQEQHQGSWLTYDGARPSVRMFTRGESSFAFVSAESGIGCGSYRGEGWAIFRAAAGAWQVTSHAPHHVSFFAPSSAFDADGDGVPEFLGDGLRLIQNQNGSLQIVLDANPPSHDCPC